MGEFRRDRLPDALTYYRDTEGLTLAGRGPWRTTSCVFHGGSDSMRINVETGGFVCMAGCGASGGDVLAYYVLRHGLGFVEAARALGAYVDDGRPPRGPSRASVLPPRDGLALLRDESFLVTVAACNLGQNIALSDEDRARLVRAAARVDLVAEACGVRA